MRIRVYDRVVIDMASGRIIEEEGWDHYGPMARLKGGSQTTNTQDPVYNARMASISEAQQAMADKYYAFWETGGGKALESEQVAANRLLVPVQTEAQLRDIAFGGEEQNFQRTQMAAAEKLLPRQTEVGLQQLTAKSQAIDLARRGVDERDAMAAAGADTAAAFARQKGASLRDLTKRGLNPTSEAGQAILKGDAAAQALGQAGAQTTARRKARTDSFSMLAQVAGSA